MKDMDDILYDGEYEKLLYDNTVSEINERVDQENEYVKSSGIYTKEEVEQIIDSNNQIRNEKLAEAKKAYEEAIAWVKEQKQLDAEERQLKRDIRALKREIAELDADSISVANDINDQMYRAYREERAAYDDFIASLDMGDD
jgi:hypothetical protein